jgi:undecaprenyl-phosphate glucose phosphotransferase
MQRGIKLIESNVVWLHRIIDAALPIFILYISTLLYAVQWHDRYIIMGTLAGLLFTLSSQTNGTYRNWHGLSFFSSIKTILKSWLWTWAVLIIIAFLYKDTHNFSRFVIILWALFTPFTLVLYRLLLRAVLIRYRKYGSRSRNVAITGAGKVGQHMANLIQSNKWLGYNVVAFFDDNTRLIDTEINGISVVGSTAEIKNFANMQLFDELYICLPLRTEQKIKQLLNELADTTAIVKYIPDLFTFDLMHARWSEMNGIPIISVYDTPLSSRTVQMIKRFEDVVLSTFIMLLISPVLFAVAIGVKLSSPGPILFKQKRYGMNGKEIKIYKFRSMSTLDDGKVIHQATKNDPRITSFGSFIRKTSLDELPQFFNVWQGKMSIVGPRPHAVAHNEEYRKLVPKYMQRHIVKPGITGWAQINGWRGETDKLEKMEKRIEFDLHYINNWSLWLDIKIIFLTIIKGFINKNAY